MVPGEGFEPPTFGLQNRCTATVLTRQINDLADVGTLQARFCYLCATYHARTGPYSGEHNQTRCSCFALIRASKGGIDQLRCRRSSRGRNGRSRLVAVRDSASAWRPGAGGTAGRWEGCRILYRTAIAISQEQEAKSLELRAAALARLWAIRGVAPRRTTCLRRYLTGSLKGLILPISKKQLHCSTSWRETEAPFRADPSDQYIRGNDRNERRADNVRHWS